MVRHVLVRHRRLFIGGFHALLVTLAYVVSFALRFDFQIVEPYRGVLLRTLPVVLLVKLLVFYGFGLFRGWWKYVGMSDLIDIAKATTVASLIVTGVIAGFFSFLHFPRAVLILDFAATFLFVGGVRFLVRAYTETFRLSVANVPVKTVLVVGAGTTGHHLVREMRSNDALNYEPVGFVDDDPTKLGIKVHGLPVLGTSQRIPEIVGRHEVDEVLIAIPSATGRQIRGIVDICRSCGISFKTMPAVGDLIGGRVSVSQLRNVEIEDLLGRDPVPPDLALVRRSLSGERVLITGAAGSIGSELARQVAAVAPDRLILFERGESELHDLELSLRRQHPDLPLHGVIGDILDPEELRQVFAAHEPSRVFHAAAYKHVLLMERHPVAAVRHNVIGTANVARAALRHGCERFILISSDKAVRPTSLMGATKRAAERAVLGMNGASTRFSAVRFGNVLGSRGSVVPIFKQQIAAGGPVTVTDARVYRFFMTVPEAVQLVLQASAMGRGGEVFHLDMGEPVRILDLAENLIRLSGLEPGHDIEVVFTGLRPGEKLFEELLAEGEGVEPTSHEKIRLLRGDREGRGLRSDWLTDLEGAALVRDPAALLALLSEAVPEYTPSELVLAAAASRATV